MNNDKIFLSLIEPPMIFGVAANFLMIIFTLAFFCVIVVGYFLGKIVMMLSLGVVIYFYYYGLQKSKTDPYWLNTILMVLLFEKGRIFKKIHILRK